MSKQFQKMQVVLFRESFREFVLKECVIPVSMYYTADIKK